MTGDIADVKGLRQRNTFVRQSMISLVTHLIVVSIIIRSGSPLIIVCVCVWEDLGNSDKA